MGGTRAAAAKRWRKRGERQRMSRLMRSRFHPKLTVGTKPNLRRDLPSEVTDLLDTLGNDSLAVVAFSPLRIGHCDFWRIDFIVGTHGRLKERFYPLVQECGLDIYNIKSRPLPDLGAVSVAIIVGSAKGER